jgi:UDP:flavonoid glycosyltransferase YjiC (YdhE family)
MTTLVIATQGTLGDHLPYFALGRLLQARGHQVRMAVNPAMLTLAAESGLTAVPCGILMGETEARRGATDWDELQYSIAEQIPQWQAFCRREIPLAFAQLCEICADADVLICAYQRHTLAALTAARTGIAWLTTSLMPALHCAPPSPERAALGEALTHTLAEIITELGVTPNWEQPAQRKQAILAASPHFSSVSAAHAFYTQTGFWFYDDLHQKTQNHTDLYAFLQRYPEPLVLSFSSLPLQHPAEVLALHVRAAAQLGRGLVVQRGWANFHADLLPDDCDNNAVFFSDFLPHPWLFSRAAAVIHHGGIGTIANAIRQSCPMLVEPYGNDQFFNARQIVAHGIGAAAHPHKITVNGLIRLLEQKVLTPHCRAQVQDLAVKINAENGLQMACERIEKWFFA